MNKRDSVFWSIAYTDLLVKGVKYEFLMFLRDYFQDSDYGLQGLVEPRLGLDH